MGCSIRPAAEADADEVGRVHVRAWQAAYTGGLMPQAYLDSLSASGRSDGWRRMLAAGSKPGVGLFVAVHESGPVIGFIAFGPRRDEWEPSTGEVYAINVDPDHWRLSVGSDLFEAGIDALIDAGFKRAVLWVHPENDRAIGLYESRGWAAAGEKRTEEVLGATAPEILMARPLP